METLLDIDKHLFLFLNNLGSESWDTFWLILTNKFSSIPLYILLLIVIYKNYGLKVTLMVLVAIALMITCTDQLANVFKHGFERRRPCHADTLGQYARIIAERCGRFGYFSAHAASSMALAIYVSYLLKTYYKYIFYCLFIWAFAVGYSRIYVGVHYPLDVITGFIIGGFIGYGFYNLTEFARRKLISN